MKMEFIYKFRKNEEMKNFLGNISKSKRRKYKK